MYLVGVAQSDIDFQTVTGFTVTVTPAGTKLWDITISGSTDSAETVWIWSTDDTDSIRKLTVTDTSGGPNILSVSVADPSFVHKIVNITGASVPGGACITYTDDPFDLNLVDISGSLSGTVRFKSLLDKINVSDNINADIESLGDIGIIQANGYIRGRISTVPVGGGCNDTYGRIRRIRADKDGDGIGDLGAPGASNWLKIDYGSLVTQAGQNTGNTGMESLQGASIYVDLNGTNGNDDVSGGNLGGWFLHMETTASSGVFNGNFHVNRLTALANFAEDMIVNGDINANIMIDWLWTTKIQCNGDFNGSITTGALFYNRPGNIAMNHGLEIFGDLNGAICFGGHKSGTCGNDGSQCTGDAWKADANDDFDPVDSIEFPILIHGDIGMNGSLSMERTADLGDSDDSSSTLIKDASSSGRDGRIVVDGNVLGNISIIGDVEGLIEVKGSILWDQVNNRPGLVSIAGSLQTTATTQGQIIIRGNVDGEIDITQDILAASGTICFVDVRGDVNGFINIGGSVLTDGELSFNAINPAGEIWIGKDFDGQIFIQYQIKERQWLTPFTEQLVYQDSRRIHRGRYFSPPLG